MAKEYLSVGLPIDVANDVKATARLLGRTQMSLLVDAWANYRLVLGDALRKQADHMDATLDAPDDPSFSTANPRVGTIV